MDQPTGGRQPIAADVTGVGPSRVTGDCGIVTRLASDQAQVWSDSERAMVRYQ